MKKKSAHLYVVLPICALVLSIILNAVIMYGSKVGGEQSIDVFDYLYITPEGVEGNATIQILIDEYELMEDIYSEAEQDRIIQFIQEITFYVDDKMIVVNLQDDYDFIDDSEMEYQLKDVEQEVFDIKNGETITVMLKDIPTQFDIKATEQEVKVSGLGKEIKNIHEVSEEMLGKFEIDVSSYVSLGFSFLHDYRDVENAIAQGHAKRYGAYYKVEPFNPNNTGIENPTSTSGLTLSLAYEYRGKVYLLTRTNLSISPYSFTGSLLTYGDVITFHDFDFSEDENSVLHINHAMSQRGYQFLTV